jgi:cytochrome-b5 reductase
MSATKPSSSSSSSNNSIWIALPTVGITMMAILSTTMHHLLPSSSHSDILSETNKSNPSILIISSVISLIGAMVYYIAMDRYPRGPKKVLPLTEYQPIPLLRKQILSHDTRRFTFGLPSKDQVLGLPTGQHVSLKFTATVIDEETGKEEKKMIIRSYTPVTDDTTAIGEFSLVIKVYRPLPPKFPNGGYMSQHLDDLKVGDLILMKGPKGHLHYTNKTPSSCNSKMTTTFTVKPLGKPLETRHAQYYGMMSGGTGITPMLQVLNCMFRHLDSNPNICVKLIYANQTVDDILVRDELESLQRDFPTRFQLYYTVDKAPIVTNDTNTNNGSKWEYGVGFISKDMIQQHLLFAEDNGQDMKQQFFMCGK